MNTYQMEVVYNSGQRKTKAVKGQHKYEAYTKFLKSIPLNQLEEIKAIHCEVSE
ncbi:hypothetical protein M3689_00910 [Alkalihalophilus marmarensis]|uniref:hypothetical protein n=1 Tax=Alkalihalophilus marmarensis TaxID=521377 RepID=UPI00203DD04F|nr:hypothetical protein [Alkalihalophilus marmarensis]MCM3487859.1 hypothetical protein [Alkalihalophilus marmarensis]